MNLIQVMDPTLTNKIAAGEVVERPASIVKELVENAIDAKSTVIEIALEEAGLTSIRVTDNGKGMSTEDALLAFERHATSKITNEHDLFRIRTLGFRGEALASISSVSKIKLWTSDGESTGTEVHIDGGHLVKHSPAALRKGTDLTVSQLFYNTPARLKYMKTIQTELGHIIDLVNRLALSHPKISFKLSHASQVLLQTMGSGNQLRVLSDIYGMSVAKKMIAFEGENADYEISGFVSLPELTRASRNYITVLVNGRWVRSFLINKAMLDAFHTLLPIGRFPIAVINIKGDPFLTDVNVHPSKQQIRLSKEGELLSLIEQSVRNALQNNLIVPSALKKEKIKSKLSEQTTIWEQPRRLDSQESVPTEREYQKSSAFNHSVPSPMNDSTEQAEVTQENKDLVPPLKKDDWVVQEDSFHQENESKSTGKFPELFPVGQVHGTYIIAQNEDGFFMIDQHAAQERIKYEFYRDQLKTTNYEERQTLLMPIQFDYSLDEKTIIEENMKDLKEVGVFLESFGPTAYVVREYPTWFPEGEEKEMIEGIIEQVLTSRKIDIGKLREEAAIMMSCKRSIKANHYLTMNDMQRLLEDLSNAENPFTCPHGRPVLIHFTTYEIEKMFKRVM